MVDPKADPRIPEAFELKIGPKAVKALKKIDARVATSVMSKMETIAADPFGIHPNAKALAGSKSEFRLRVGDWRVLYRIDQKAKIVAMEDVLKREEAYR